MPIILYHQLREHIPHNAIEFPITYYHDELVTLPDRTGPLHWHPDFEIATAKKRRHFSRSVTHVVSIRQIISAVSSRKGMGMRLVRVMLWVNSA
uniref:hypothetical protein n=1 Tax=Gemmiger formicilis TaxID=745368 RepID=UPI003FEFD836